MWKKALIAGMAFLFFQIWGHGLLVAQENNSSQRVDKLECKHKGNELHCAYSRTFGDNIELKGEFTLKFLGQEKAKFEGDEEKFRYFFKLEEMDAKAKFQLLIDDKPAYGNLNEKTYSKLYHYILKNDIMPWEDRKITIHKSQAEPDTIKSSQVVDRLECIQKGNELQCDFHRVLADKDSKGKFTLTLLDQKKEKARFNGDEKQFQSYFGLDDTQAKRKFQELLGSKPADGNFREKTYGKLYQYISQNDSMIWSSRKIAIHKQVEIVPTPPDPDKEKDVKPVVKVNPIPPPPADPVYYAYRQGGKIVHPDGTPQLSEGIKEKQRQIIADLSKNSGFGQNDLLIIYRGEQVVKVGLLSLPPSTHSPNPPVRPWAGAWPGIFVMVGSLLTLACVWGYIAFRLHQGKIFGKEPKPEKGDFQWLERNLKAFFHDFKNFQDNLYRQGQLKTNTIANMQGVDSLGEIRRKVTSLDQSSQKIEKILNDLSELASSPDNISEDINSIKDEIKTEISSQTSKITGNINTQVTTLSNSFAEVVKKISAIEKMLEEPEKPRLSEEEQISLKRAFDFVEKLQTWLDLVRQYQKALLAYQPGLQPFFNAFWAEFESDLIGRLRGEVKLHRLGMQVEGEAYDVTKEVKAVVFSCLGPAQVLMTRLEFSPERLRFSWDNVSYKIIEDLKSQLIPAVSLVEDRPFFIKPLTLAPKVKFDDLPFKDQVSYEEGNYADYFPGQPAPMGEPPVVLDITKWAFEKDGMLLDAHKPEVVIG